MLVIHTGRYQTAHFLTGFIGVPTRQLNALANSGKFITDALALGKNENKNFEEPVQ